MSDYSDAGSDSIGEIPVPKQRSGLRLFDVLVVLVLSAVAIALLVAFLLPSHRVARPAAHRAECRNNLKQIVLALRNYHEVWNAFPPAHTVDAEGNPLHSWRTLILPYLARQSVYESIDLSKPWNDPGNREAYETGISAYRCPSLDVPETHTTYMAVLAPGSCLQPTVSRQRSEITDAEAETLVVIEVDSGHAVHWMRPFDADEALVLGIGPNSELAHSGGFNAAFVDNTVRFHSAETPAAKRREWISVSGDGD